jgi:hypothetical protein
MIKFAKFISNTYVEFPPKNKGSVLNYNTNYELLIQDGYKQFFEIERPQTNRRYHIEYIEVFKVEDGSTFIEETVVYDETQQEADARDLENAKNNKINENDTARDVALLQGVTYKDVLFDSDTDQKVNLLAIVSTMGEEDTIVWFGMNNQPLECTKQDLINIGGLITQLHAFCWSKNAEIKALIAAAQTIEEVNEIDIHYILPLETESEETNED